MNITVRIEERGPTSDANPVAYGRVEIADPPLYRPEGRDLVHIVRALTPEELELVRAIGLRTVEAVRQKLDEITGGPRAPPAG